MKKKNYVFYNMLANDVDGITKKNLQTNNPPEYSQYQQKQKNIDNQFYSLSANNQDKILLKNLQTNNPSQTVNLNKVIPVLSYKNVDSGNAMKPYYSILPY